MIDLSAIPEEVRRARERACKVCGLSKRLDDFYASAGCREGRRPECKACTLSRQHKSRKSAVARFVEKCRITPGCWIWVGASNGRGYGSFGLNGKTLGAHRAAYLLYVGHIPEGLDVCHRCDNRLCVNPEHLFLGTNHENVIDRHNKGRSKMPCNKGSRNGMAKLLEQQIAEIRADKRLHREIAADYGIARATVGDIKAGRRWGQA